MGRTLGQNQFEYNLILKNFKQIKSQKILQANRDCGNDGNKIMSRLVNLTLKESGLSAEFISKREINTRQIINDIVDELCADHAIKKSNFHVFDVPNIKGDARQIKHLLKQMLSNAVLYRSSLKPEIIISSEQIKDDLVFSIQDNGIGIDKEYITEIFKPFNRGAIKNECRGVGLGLSISKQIVRHHDGKIWAQSLGRSYGSTFYFSLPTKSQNVLSVKHAFAVS